jgi:hypothetical protein
MSGEERLKMTINGEPVAEIDIRASYLTIFLSMHGTSRQTAKTIGGTPAIGGVCALANMEIN